MDDNKDIENISFKLDIFGTELNKNITVTTLSNENIMPLPSPFKSIPVFSPNPNKSIYENNFSFPSLNPKETNPGFVLVNTATF